LANRDGQILNHKAPKQAELTENGEQYLEDLEREDLDQHENLSHRELVEKVYTLENQVEDLEQKFEVFQNQILEEID